MKGTRPESNLTGGQIQQVLDKILYDSVYLLLPHGIFNSTLITILSSSVLDKRRKISATEYEKSIDLMCYLVTNSSKDSFSDLKDLKIERMVYLKQISEIISKVTYENYICNYFNWLKTGCKLSEKNLSSVEKSIGIDRDNLYMIYQNLVANNQEFMEFKTSVLKQYINLAHKYSSSQIKNKNKNLSYDDLFQNIVAAISKAIDKYDSSKGALTSYIKYWIINALNQDNSQVNGLAYEITHSQRKKLARKESNQVNFSAQLSDMEYNSEETPETIVENSSEVLRIMKLVKRADINGVFRLINNIDEFLFDSEKNKMKKHMRMEIKANKNLIK